MHFTQWHWTIWMQVCSCEPVAAMVFGICFFGEIPTVLSITGLIIVLAALAMLVLPEKKTHKKRD